MKTKIIKIAILIISVHFLSWFYSCGAGLPSADEQTIKHKPVEMASYSVNYPIGNDWKCERNNSLNKIIFTRDKSSTSTDVLGILTGAGTEGYTFISINENQLKADTTTSKWGEIETADDYMKNEVKKMKEEGVKTGMYKLKNILKTDTVINGKKFYCMDYEQHEIRNEGNSYFYSDCKLALYFPDNFKEIRMFYVFNISDFSNSITIGKDAGQLYPVLAGFKLNSEAL